MPDFPLIATKFHLPLPGASLIERPHLYNLLEKGLEQPLTLLSAPPGFGKTMLVAQWIHQRSSSDDLKTVWLSLDEYDDEQHGFWQYFMTAIQKVFPQITEIQQTLLTVPNPPQIQEILSMVINDLEAINLPLLIVLDDYHHIQSAEIHAALSFFLDHQPGCVHLVLLTREDPPLALARRRARGQLIEIRSSDLRFDLQETDRFINQTRGLSLTPDQIRSLEQRTEGWVAGLQMAVLSLQGREAGSFFESLGGDNRYIADYLIEEVLQRQSDSIQSFLLKSSILENLSADLCAQLYGDPASARGALDYLERSNLFLIPLDGRREWYRYHHLFADLLRQRLREKYPAREISQLHRSASTWFEQRSDIASAVHHAREIPDHTRVLELLEHNVGDFFQNNTLHQMYDLARTIPQELRETSPLLCGSVAWAALATNHFSEVDDWLQAIERHFGHKAGSALTEPTLQTGLRAALLEVLVIRQQLPSDDSPSEKIPRAQEILSQLNTLRPDQRCVLNTVASLKPVIAYNLGINAEMIGDTHSAAQVFVEAVDLSREQQNQHIFLLSLSHLAGIQLLQGRLRDTRRTFTQALSETQNLGPGRSPFLSLIYAGLGTLDYEANDLTSAEKYFTQALPLARIWDQWESLVPIALGRAHLKQRQGDVQSALAILDEVKSPPLARMVPMLESSSALLRAKSGQLMDAENWLLERGNSLAQSISTDNETVLLNIARLMFLLDRTEESLSLIRRIIDHAQSALRNHILIQAKILQAKLLTAQGKLPDAVKSLKEGLTLAAPEGYISTFLDEGEIIRKLLGESRSRMPADLKSHIDRILAGFPTGEMAGARPETGGGPGLSERETEILHLVAAGLSNQEIADHLVISITTVKTHISNIFNKFGVTSRTQAVAHAKGLGLLPRQ